MLTRISHQISTATAKSASSASSDSVGHAQHTVKYASHGLGRLPRIQGRLGGLVTKSDEKSGLRIFVKVKPKSKQEKIKQIDSTHFEICVKEPPQEGRANQAVIEALSEFLNVPKSSLKILSGHTSRQKVIEVQ